jgi:hypothetical protein
LIITWDEKNNKIASTDYPDLNLNKRADEIEKEKCK